LPYCANNVGPCNVTLSIRSSRGCAIEAADTPSRCNGTIVNLPARSRVLRGSSALPAPHKTTKLGHGKRAMLARQTVTDTE
jgi:hypothetical protein